MSAYKTILSGYNWNSAPTLVPQKTPIFLTYSFPKESGWFDLGFKPFGKADQQLARYALKQWADACGIRFFETKSGDADITFSWYYSAFGNTVAYADFPELSTPYKYAPGEVLERENDVGVHFNLDSRDELNANRSYKTYVMLHEIGHALGLKHPFHKMPFNKKLMSKGLDHTRNTVMSYDNGDSDIYPTTLRRYDKIAIKELYGLNSADGKHVSSWSWNARTETLKQVGKASADRIHGTAVDDLILGLDGNDRIYGHDGDNTLNGGAGNDTLAAGYGDDAFVFDTALDPASNVDKIAGFDKYDVIHLSSAIFTGLALGELPEDRFSNSGKAQDKDEFIVLDTSSGQIFYDPDGSGAVEKVLFAKIVTLGFFELEDVTSSYFYII
jgi:hypothetical protein